VRSCRGLLNQRGSDILCRGRCEGRGGGVGGDLNVDGPRQTRSAEESGVAYGAWRVVACRVVEKWEMPISA